MCIFLVNVGVLKLMMEQLFTGQPLLLGLFFYVLTMVLGMELGRHLIPLLAKSFAKQGQPIRTYGPAIHIVKHGTPNMGGFIVFAPLYLVWILATDIKNTWYMLVTLLAFNVLGFVDDYYKATRKDIEGVRPKVKLRAQFAAATFFVICHLLHQGITGKVLIPFFGHLDIGFLILPLSVLVIVGASNAVNLTDGLDGLVSIPLVTTAAFFLAAIALIMSANTTSSIVHYDLAAICLAFMGSITAFLWYNAHPARIFMGDGGSLACGALMGCLSIYLELELFLAIAGLLFVIETLSVIVQIAYFRHTKGKRLFLMTPIHHHFEQLGIHETTITTRMWLFSCVCSLFAVTILRMTL